jgi:O-antigen/teichoic acid export membrane protein
VRTLTRLIQRLRGLGNGAFAVADQAVVSACNFATSVLLGRMASQEDLGIYFLALSLFYFVRGLQEQLISAPFLIYSQKRPAGALAAYAGSTLVHQAGMSVAAMLGLVVLAAVLATGHGPQQFAAVVPVLLGAMPFLLLRDFVRQYSFARFEVRRALVFDATAAVLQVGGLALLAALGRLSVTTTYAVMAMACAGATLGWFLLARPPVAFRRSDVMADWRQNWAFGRWAVASQLIGCTMPYVMPWIVATSEGEQAAGVFGASSTLVGIANMFVLGLSNYLSPRAAQAYTVGGVPELQSVLKRIALLFVAALGSFSLITLVAGERLLALVYGDAFRGGEMIISLLALNLLVSSLGLTAGNGLWAMERPQANFAADITALLTTLAATAWLVPLYHTQGTAGAMLIGTAAGMLVRTATLLRLLHESGMRAARETLRAAGGDA